MKGIFKNRIIQIGAFLLALCAFSIKRNSMEAPILEEVPSAQTQNSIHESLNMSLKAREFTEERIEEWKSVSIDKIADKALQIFKENISNVFFDSEHFFANLELKKEDIKSFQEKLLSTENLDKVVFSKNLEEIPEFLEDRMRIIDLMREYANARRTDPVSEEILSTFVSLVSRNFDSQISIKVKKILLAEKVDCIRALTALDKKLAAETLNSLDPKVKESLKFGYFIGLESLDENEYKIWTQKVL
jgi:hypothetical protein